MKFSHRIGFTPVNETLQIENISQELRNSLWNLLHINIWDKPGFISGTYSSSMQVFMEKLTLNYYKEPLDEIPPSGRGCLEKIRGNFFRYKWFEVYEFIEEILNGNYIFQSTKDDFVKVLNIVLHKELAGYRFTNNRFIPITSQTEIAEIEEAINNTPFQGVQIHLNQALDLLSNKEQPDYRNSIKESISAVESMAQEVTGEPKATLGNALKLLEKDGRLHPALQGGFSKIYGYTSDESGIRHALSSKSEIDLADAKYFLISCSAFINYLKTKII